MFKKKLNLGKESLLSSKDKKTLQARLQGLEVFSKGSKLKKVTISGTKVKVYFEEIENVWVSILVEANLLFPSIFTLWSKPELLPIVYVWPPVSCFLMNGADLMWPGVVNQDEVRNMVKVGSLVAICVVGNVPMAVGTIKTMCSPGDYKGKCVEVLHCYRDELWMMRQCVPNEGFGIDIVTGIYGGQGEKSSDVEENNEEIEEIHGVVEGNQEVVEESHGTLETNQEIDSTLLQELVKVDETQGIDEKTNLETEKNLETPDEPLEEEKIPLEKPHFSKSPDETVMAIFLTALKIGITDSMLPLEPSALLNYMSRCKRDLDLNFSKTTYKKLGKFLQYTNGIKLISYEKPKGQDHKLITFINKTHELLIDCVPIINKLKAISQETTEKGRNLYPKIQFTPGFIPKSQYNSIFSQFFQNPHKVLLSKSETTAFLHEYLNKNNLTSTKTTVFLDKLLQKALNSEEEIKKSELFKNFQKLFDEGYIEEFTSGLMPSAIKLGKIPIISISLERSIYKKKLTRVKGCDDYLIDMKEILGILQRSLAASASLLEKTSKNKVKVELQVQGNHINKISEILTENFSVPQSQIRVSSKI